MTLDFEAGRSRRSWGRPGSGKSSLLRVLTGIDRATSGDVWVGPRNVARASARGLRRLRRDTVGYVFQRPSDNFLPNLTIGEHLRLAARDERATDLDVLDRLGIGHRVDHLPDELSGGEQQRAAFAQAVVAGSAVVVADEPTAELDSDPRSRDGRRPHAGGVRGHVRRRHPRRRGPTARRRRDRARSRPRPGRIPRSGPGVRLRGGSRGPASWTTRAVAVANLRRCSSPRRRRGAGARIGHLDARPGELVGLVGARVGKTTC